MTESRRTRSGYTYRVVSVAEVETVGPGDWFVWTCQEPRCGVVVQGGHRALAEHIAVVHPECSNAHCPTL